MRRIFRFSLVAAVVIAAAASVYAATDQALNWTRMRALPKNFSEVRAGVLYRSGQLRAEHFRSVVEKTGIRTVVCLNPTDRPEERRLCDEMGVRFRSFIMPGSGLGSPEGFHEFLRIVAEPKNQPVLVHCAAGAYRTGVAVAAYRCQFEGWTIDDAIEEMRYSGCLIDGDVPLQDHVRAVVDAIPADLRDVVGR